MDDYLNFNENGKTEIDVSSKKASFFKKLADGYRIQTISSVFQLIKSESRKGNYSINLNRELADVEKDFLEEYGFDVYRYDDSDDEWDEGIKATIEWDNPTDEDE